MQAEKSSPGIIGPIIVGVVVALLSGATVPWWWEKIFGGDKAAAPSPTSQTITQTRKNPQASVGPVTTTNPTHDSGKCTITIANQLAVLRETPEPFGQQILNIPAGVYETLDVQNTPWAGTTERWFKIVVNGRSGWIMDDTFGVASKSIPAHSGGRH